MRVPRLSAIAVGVAAFFVLAPTAASAITLGSVATSSPGPCVIGPISAFLVQTGTESIPYSVPAGGGVITSWSMSFGPAGAPVTLLVTGPGSSGSLPAFTIAGFDAETVPSPVPAGNVATFTLGHPMFVQAGDLIGLYYTGNSNTACIYSSASSSDMIAAGGPAPPPAVGGTYTAAGSDTGALINVSVNLLQSADMGLSGATATPSAITTGGIADVAFPITSNVEAPGTFTDTLPTGLVPIIASVGGGSCTITGQSVSCPVSTKSATVKIAVQGSIPGTYTDAGQITGELSDPNPGNNSTSVTLAVVSPSPTPTCHVIKLKGAPIAVARAVLPLLNCKVGKISKASSKTVRKGDVISTSPGPGAHPAGTKVSVKESSGRKKKKTKRGH
jgi:Domain of unknown function DUF11